jgi:hypothetical protein
VARAAVVPTRSLRRCTLARRIYIVRKLLDAGAVPGERAGLVLFAVQEGDAELLQRLLSDLPVDVDAQDARGMSALHRQTAACSIKP